MNYKITILLLEDDFLFVNEESLAINLNFLNFDIFQNQTKYKDITNIVLTTKTNKLAC